MTTTAFKVMATTFVMSLTLTAWAQPPDDGPPRGRGGQPGKGQQGKGQFGKGQQGKGQQGKGQQDGRPRFQLGTVIPPQMRGDLNLTSSQEKEINGIEKDVKTKLEKILSKDQIDSLNNPPMGGGPGLGSEIAVVRAVHQMALKATMLLRQRKNLVRPRKKLLHATKTIKRLDADL